MGSVTARELQPKVLIVDDDPLARSFLRTALEEDARVVEAETGEQAIAILEAPRRTLDIVLLDHVLPGQSGLEILQLTRRRWPWISVIILTAFGSEDLAAQALRAGASDYLKKPVPLDRLKESVRALTTGRGKRAGRSVTIPVEENDEACGVHPSIRRALAFMREHFAEEITLESAAGEAAFSKFHFCRLFHHETGVLFHEYLHELRVSRAKALLADRHLAISEVAYKVGFNDLSHFDRTFRRIVGGSPTEYRASLAARMTSVTWNRESRERRMRPGKAIILVIAMLGLTPFPAEPAARTVARFSFSSGWDAVPAVVAIDRGFFAQEELVVDGLARSSEGPVAQSLVAGSTDFATVPQRTLLVMAALRLPVKVISTNGWGTEIEVVVPKTDTAIKTTAHLKGKTIGVGVASEAYPVLIRLLNKAKLRPMDVNIKHLSPNDLTRAFKDKARLADAVIESRHYTATLVETGQARVLLATKDIVSAVGFIGAAPLVTRTALIEKEPETVQKFLNAWVKALAYIPQDPEDAARLMAIFFHRQGVVNMREGLVKSWLSMTRYGRAVWSKDDIADAEYNGWALKEGGILKVAPTLAGYVENRFAEEALKRLAADGGAGEGQSVPARR